jgi:glycosyltransferase involved in cell wall biosynthesis
MMQLVSIIIPTKNNQDVIGDLLESIKRQTYKDIETIIVDDGKDKTSKIAQGFTAKVIKLTAERSKKRNYAARKAKGDFLFFIDSDMKLSKNVVADCIALVNRNKKVKAITIPEESFGTGFWAQCKKLERSFYLGVDEIESPRFYDKESFFTVGEYEEDISGGEDYDLANKFKMKFGKNSIGRIKSFILHNEGNLSLINSCKKKFYYAKDIDKYKLKSASKVRQVSSLSIFNRYILFLSNPSKLFKNPAYGFGMLFMKSAEIGAGGLGYISYKLLGNQS